MPGRVSITILPLSLPRHFAKSRSRAIGATITAALSAVPFVPGVQAMGIAVSCTTRGVVIRTLDRSIDQPRPNANPSLWTFVRPQSAKRRCVHASAVRIDGELVSRGPITSVRCWTVTMTWLWLVPSSMMRLTMG